MRRTGVERTGVERADVERNNRNRQLVSGIVSGLLTKAIGFMVTLVTVPLTLHYLGPEQYGVWVTMISVLAWIGIVDLGLVNGLTPALSSALGRDNNELAQQYVATAFWGVAIITTVSAIVLAVLWPWLDWGAVFNIESPLLEQQISIAMALAIGFFLLNMVLSLVKPIFFAHQEGATANFWQMLLSVIGGLGLYLVTHTQGGLVYLVLGYSGAQTIVMMISVLWLLTRSKPHLHPFIRPDPANAKRVFSLGGLFFVNQLATLAMYQKDNILIAQILGPGQVAPYSVTWQLFLYLNLITILVAPYLGPGYGEAYARGDLLWMRKAFFRHILISSAIGLPATSMMVLFHEQILAIWLGGAVPLPSQNTVLWIAAFTAVMSLMGPIIALLNGTGHLRIFTIVYVIATMLGLPLSILLIRKFGVSGGAMASAITIVVLVYFPAMREVLKILKPFDPLATPDSTT